MYKHRQIKNSEDEKKPDLPVDYESDRYILLPSLKVLNCPINLGEKTRN